MGLILVIGNKNYSSWSMRPWIAMTGLGIAFDEVVIPLYESGSQERIRGYSPAGRVPVLVDGDIKVWESLAILEYLADRFPHAGVWPDDRAVRAHARVISSEMHAGFGALRRECPMNMWRPPERREISADAQANVGRLDAMWSECRSRFGAGGPFLFGRFCAADAMYAPVVSRFLTYDIAVSETSRGYMNAVQSLPAWQAWRGAALREPWLIPHDEPDWPTVKRLPI